MARYSTEIQPPTLHVTTGGTWVRWHKLVSTIGSWQPQGRPSSTYECRHGSSSHPGSKMADAQENPKGIFWGIPWQTDHEGPGTCVLDVHMARLKLPPAG